jgi:hypothetical protein
MNTQKYSKKAAQQVCLQVINNQQIGVMKKGIQRRF